MGMGETKRSGLDRYSRAHHATGYGKLWMDRRTEEQMEGIVSGMMYWVERIAWEKISLLDEEFDQMEYGQHIEQRYFSKKGKYNNFIPEGKSPEEYKNAKTAKN